MKHLLLIVLTLPVSFMAVSSGLSQISPALGWYKTNGSATSLQIHVVATSPSTAGIDSAIFTGYINHFTFFDPPFGCVLSVVHIGLGFDPPVLFSNNCFFTSFGAPYYYTFAARGCLISSRQMTARFYARSNGCTGATDSLSLQNPDGIIVSVKDQKMRPETFALLDNYPNPFNPTTLITYEVPQPAHVRLAIIDLLGREVQTLVDDMRNPGEYKISWNSDRMSSGVYYYRMQAGNFVKTKKLVLLK